MNSVVNEVVMISGPLQAYFSSLSALLLFLVIVVKCDLLQKRTRQLFLIEAVVLLILIASSWGNYAIIHQFDPGDYVLVKEILFSIQFVLCPVSPLMIVLIFMDYPSTKYEKLLFLPLMANIVMAVGSIFYDWVFSVDQSGTYHRGPWFWITFAVAFFYMLSMLHFSYRQKNRLNKHVETVLLSGILLLIAAATMIEIFFRVSFLIWSTTVVTVIIYYLFLTVQIILYDPLTGCYSRIAYSKKLGLIDSLRDCTLAMVDVNDLKRINDQFGHEQGDKAICDVVNAIMRFKSSDMDLYRFGGDEFVLLSSKCRVEKMTKVLKQAQGYLKESEPGYVSFAYGVTIYNKRNDIHEAIAQADEMMYLAKQCEKGCIPSLD